MRIAPPAVNHVEEPLVKTCTHSEGLDFNLRHSSGSKRPRYAAQLAEYDYN